MGSLLNSILSSSVKICEPVMNMSNVDVNFFPETGSEKNECVKCNVLKLLR